MDDRYEDMRSRFSPLKETEMSSQRFLALAERVEGGVRLAEERTGRQWIRRARIGLVSIVMIGGLITGIARQGGGSQWPWVGSQEQTGSESSTQLSPAIAQERSDEHLKTRIADAIKRYEVLLARARDAVGDLESIDGHPVSNKAWRMYQANQILSAIIQQHAAPTTQTMLQNFQRDQVTFLEAEKDHYAVTLAEARMRAQRDRASVEHFSSNYLFIQEVEAVEAVFHLTDDQYWNSFYPEENVEDYSISAMRVAFDADSKVKNPGISEQQIIKLWQQIEDEHVQQAHIVKLTP